MKKLLIYEQFINDFGGVEDRIYAKTVTDEKFNKSYKDYVGAKCECGGCYMDVTVMAD